MGRGEDTRAPGTARHAIPPLRVRQGAWIGDCFLFTNRNQRLNYYIGGEVVTLAVLERRMYLLGYVPPAGPPPPLLPPPPRGLVPSPPYPAPCGMVNGGSGHGGFQMTHPRGQERGGGEGMGSPHQADSVSPPGRGR